jgi:hypothetical protein
MAIAAKPDRVAPAGAGGAPVSHPPISRLLLTRVHKPWLLQQSLTGWPRQVLVVLLSATTEDAMLLRGCCQTQPAGQERRGNASTITLQLQVKIRGELWQINPLTHLTCSNFTFQNWRA